MKAEFINSYNLEILLKLKQIPDYQNYFKQFLAITQIPHPTFQCGKIANKVCEWLLKFNVSYERDDYNNIVSRLTSNNFPEDARWVSVQIHLDMVWVGEEFDGKIKVELIKNF